MVLWFGFVAKKVLITHQCSDCCWTVFSPCPMGEGSEQAAVWVFGCWPESTHHAWHEDKMSMKSNKDVCRVILYACVQNIWKPIGASVPVSLYVMVCIWGWKVSKVEMKVCTRMHRVIREICVCTRLLGYKHIQVVNCLCLFHMAYLYIHISVDL